MGQFLAASHHLSPVTCGSDDTEGASLAPRPAHLTSLWHLSRRPHPCTTDTCLFSLVTKR